MGMPSNGDVNLNLMEYDYTNYVWGVSAEASTPTKQIHTNPLSVTAPTLLVLAATATEQLTKTDGTKVNRIKVSWTASADVFSVGYEIQYKLSTDTNYTEHARSTSNTEVVTWIEGITSGVQYDVRVRAYNGIGVVSAWLSGNVTGTGVLAIGIDSNLIGADDYLSKTFFYRNRFESLDGLYSVGATIDINAGFLVLSATNGNNALARKIVISVSPTLSFSKSWKVKTDVTITSGLGQYLGTTSGAPGYEVKNRYVDEWIGMYFLWNAGTSKIDIYLYSSSGTSLATLITSIADTGLLIAIEYVFTPGVSLVGSVTISGVTYTATHTTNIPTTSLFGSTMDFKLVGTNAIAVTAKTGDYSALQE